MAAAALSTSNVGKYWDNTPSIPAAGKVITDPDDTMDSCMTYGRQRRSITPPHVKPYLKLVQHTLGKTTVHYGKAYDTPPPDCRHGRTNKYNGSAHALMNGHDESAFMEHLRTLREASRPLHQHDPLGKSSNRFNLQIPEHCKDPNYSFGCQTNKSESAKLLVYPLNDPFDDPDAATHELYVKSHRHFEAGEQKKLGYNWLAHGIDPTSFRFGKVEDHEKDGAAQALKPDATKCLTTNVVKKEVEAFKDVTHDALGQVKNYGFGKLPDLDTTFGRANKYDEWDAWQCMRGTATAEQIEPEKDLGKSTRSLKSRSPTPPLDRMFGVPSVRTDIPKPKVKRVTDFQNYGDEANAQRLIYPSAYAPSMVNEEDFSTGYPKDFIWDLQQTAGIGLDKNTFDIVWDQASAMFGTNDGTLSVENFRRAMSAMDL